ncbi:hypothetical protein [Ktedonospora formicarum]|uniref:Uncharacterized protein n=1 Tax=Ktedonospora formicarum TaxID=2778364 RepID=A0A8J3MTL5_9CHLR|nr:hypothetical protein [Ktedonospora formicarum]GHO47260.1 hypothetical protein KSX_54230 [Ktedonospora formicarum]
MKKPEHIQTIREAAARFTEQDEVIATIEIRGQVLLEDTTTRLFPDWVTVSQLDDSLNLLALGDGTELPEDARLLWVQPLQGELRLQEMLEEHEETPPGLQHSHQHTRVRLATSTCIPRRRAP